MAREHSLPPSAASLSQSMRDLGYSLETAVADLIDNSISAESSKINIICNLSAENPSLAIIDDGKGMDINELLSAMRHGSANPGKSRDDHDLGRFGLGLKTASFSQCKRLTVISSKDSKLNGAVWDLDLVSSKDDWIISILEPTEIALEPFADHLEGSGTVVIWRILDRLFEDKTGDIRDEIVNEKLDILEKHLSLVFHRFLAGEVKDRKKISLTINGHPVEAFDPFCRKNGATQVMPEEVIRVGQSTVRLQPYILPHHSRLSAIEYDFYQNRGDFISNQGAYIYRNGRLMAWGDWFRLIPKGEATKLARVQIDFSHAMDEAWTIDIKKSRARPPHAVRERLRQILSEITNRSTTVHRGRGKKLFEEHRSPFWERYADQGNIRYSLNHDHPLICQMRTLLNESGTRLFSMILESAASSLPVEMIYSDFSTHPKASYQNILEENEILERLKNFKEVLFSQGEVDAEVFREIIRSTRLFENCMETAENFISKEF